jgi:hypothetical protein
MSNILNLKWCELVSFESMRSILYRIRGRRSNKQYEDKNRTKERTEEQKEKTKRKKEVEEGS